MPTLNNLTMKLFQKENSTRTPNERQQSVRPRVNPGDQEPNMTKGKSSSRIAINSFTPRFFTQSINNSFTSKSFKPVTSPQIYKSGTVKLIKVTQIKLTENRKKPSLTLTPQQE